MPLPLLTAALPVVGKLIDRVFPDQEAADKAKLELLAMQQSGELRELEAAAGIIQAEAQSEHALTSAWRPITMLVLVGCVVGYWFGLTPETLPEAVVVEAFELVKIGLGGYVLGRSGEKIAKEWRKPG